jgi:predicted membrane channel-forming protein YqfA (hemolysin III family)
MRGGLNGGERPTGGDLDCEIKLIGRDRTPRRLRFQNVIWHCFVLLGAACHYIAVLALVLA